MTNQPQRPDRKEYFQDYAYKNKAKRQVYLREWRKRNPEKIKTYRKIQYEKNKNSLGFIDKQKSRGKKYREDNKSQISIKYKIHYNSDHEFRERVKTNAKKNYHKNPELKKEYAKRYFASNKEVVSERNKAWQQNNPEKYKSIRADINNRRRARLQKAKTEKYNRQGIFLRFGGFCIVCNEPISQKIKHPDLRCFSIHHIIPISRGGDDIFDNVAPAHLICNIKVGNKVPIAVKPRILLNV